MTKLNKVESEYSVSILNLEKQVDALLKKTSTKVELPPPVPPSKPWLKEDLFPRYPPCTLRVELNIIRRGVSPHFFSHPGGYRLELQTDMYSDMYPYIDPVDHPDNYPLKWPIKITVKFDILSQEEDKVHDSGEYSRQITSPKHTIQSIPIPPWFIKGNTLYITIVSVDVQ